MIEPLEPRIAPASLFSPRTVSYIEPDGDTVRVTISKGTWDLTNDFVFAAAGAGEQLQRIDLLGKTEFAGASITVVAAGPGDGFAHVGFIDAGLIDLGTVKIDGDLGRIAAGDSIVKTHLPREARRAFPGPLRSRHAAGGWVDGYHGLEHRCADRRQEHRGRCLAARRAP